MMTEEMIAAGGKPKWEDTCIADSAGFAYPLSVADPSAVVIASVAEPNMIFSFVLKTKSRNL